MQDRLQHFSAVLDLPMALRTKNEIEDFLSAEREDAFDLNEVGLRNEIAKENGYYFVSAFSDGRAWAYKKPFPVSNSVEIIAIDRDGEEYFREPFLDIPEYTDFKWGVAWLRVPSARGKSSWKLYSKYGEMLKTLPETDDLDIRGFAESGFVEQIHFKSQILDIEGKPRIHENDILLGATPFSDGVAWHEYPEAMELVAPVLDQGEFSVKKTILKKSTTKQISEASIFSEGISCIRNSETQENDFFDISGEKIFSTKFKVEGLFRNDRCLMRDDSGYYFIDKTGKSLLGHFASALDFSEGFAPVTKFTKEGFLGMMTAVYYIDKDGNKFGEDLDKGAGNIISFKNFSEGLAAVRTALPVAGSSKRQWFFINTKFEPTFPEAYDEMYDDVIQDFQKGVALVRIDGDTFYIDRKGRRVFS